MLFPEYTKPGENAYVYRDFRFWTSGFFPGSLYLLLERRRKYEHLLAGMAQLSPRLNTLQLEYALREVFEQNGLSDWGSGLHADIGRNLCTKTRTCPTPTILAS